jgi:arylformamidase
VLSISGIHDLRPLLLSEMNDVLKLDEAEADGRKPRAPDPRTDLRSTPWSVPPNAPN